MGDEQHRQAKPRLEVFEQVQHLCLHGDVERGDRFIGDQNFRVERQCPGNPDPLPLAAGEFVRIAFHGARVEADQTQEVVGALSRGGRIRAVGDRAIGDDIADLAARIERSERVLKYHLDAAALLA
jgi:hypothetical protein